MKNLHLQKDICRPCLSTKKGFRWGEVMRFRSRQTRSTSPWCRVDLFESCPEFYETNVVIKRLTDQTVSTSLISLHHEKQRLPLIIHEGVPD